MLLMLRYCMISLGTIERWETLASRVKQAQMADALRELAAMKTEFKAMYDRFFDHEIDVEQSNMLDDHINEITVSYFRQYIFYYAYIRVQTWKLVFKKDL